MAGLGGWGLGVLGRGWGHFIGQAGVKKSVHPCWLLHLECFLSRFCTVCLI